MDNCTIISLILAAKSKQKSEVDVRFNLLSLTFWCWELSKDFMKTEEDDIFVNKSFSFLQVDVSTVNLRLQYSSYFLFVMVITCVLYGMIKGRPVKQSKKVQIGTKPAQNQLKRQKPTGGWMMILHKLQRTGVWFCMEIQSFSLSRVLDYTKIIFRCPTTMLKICLLSYSISSFLLLLWLDSQLELDIVSQTTDNNSCLFNILIVYVKVPKTKYHSIPKCFSLNTLL